MDEEINSLIKRIKIMAIKVEDENGKEIDAFTAEEVAAKEAAIKAEYEAKLADKENHLKTKTDEFLKGKQSTELKEKEWESKIEEAKRIAEESKAQVTQSESRRIEIMKKTVMEKYVGNDPELTKKFEESWSLVNLEIKEDADILKKAELVANMAGLNNQSSNPAANWGVPMAGGYAPNFVKDQTKEKEAEYGKFKDALGLGDFLKG